MGTRTSPAATATKPAMVTVRSVRSSSVAPTGRAMTARNRNSPTAAMSASSTPHRAASSPGVAAVSRSDGTANCFGVPGPGPIANVNAPRTGWPSADTTRQ